MLLTSQGFGHFTDEKNNQDFGLETPKMLLVLDGCSGAKYSEVGTRLFSQLFSKKEDFDNHEKFEDNVKAVFDEIIGMMRKYYPTDDEIEKEFIMENLLFTIIACFKTEDKYIVKLFGDGYVVTKNLRGHMSYMKFSYGKFPPYFAYKYCSNMDEFQHYQFKTFEFGMNLFPKIAIGTDGILPFAKGEIKGIDNLISNENEIAIKAAIKAQRQVFYDDVTIGTFDKTSEVKNVQS